MLVPAVLVVEADLMAAQAALASPCNSLMLDALSVSHLSAPAFPLVKWESAILTQLS